MADKVTKTSGQYCLVLEAIAGRASTLQQLLALLQARPAPDPHALAVIVDGCEALSTMIGAMADDALGGEVIGDANAWFYGWAFAGAGAAAHACTVGRG